MGSRRSFLFWVRAFLAFVPLQLLDLGCVWMSVMLANIHNEFRVLGVHPSGCPSRFRYHLVPPSAVTLFTDTSTTTTAVQQYCDEIDQ